MIYLFIFLFFYFFIYLFIFLFIYLFIYLQSFLLFFNSYFIKFVNVIRAVLVIARTHLRFAHFMTNYGNTWILQWLLIKRCQAL